MWKNINFENCLSYINRHASSEAYVGSGSATGAGPHGFAGSEGEIHPSAKPSVTISRMCGSGGRTVASELAKYLQTHTPAGRAWTIFDKNLIAKVLEDHHLSRRIGEFLTEDGKSLLAETIEKMRGLHPPTAIMVKHTAETIWNLAASGYVILVGRAANVVTENLDNVYHVRLVGSLENRVARIEEVYEMGRADAQEFIKTQDAAKRRYLREYFGREIDDPMLYHMVINTDKISYEQAARLIGDAVINRFKLADGTGRATA
jgi:cytidylate kinase